MDVGFLDHRGERLLGHPAGLEKRREVAPFSELGDAQLDSARSGLPIAIAVAVAAVDPVGAALPVCRSGQALDLQLHQALRGKSHHLAQQIGVGVLLQQRSKAHDLVGHRRFSGLVEVWRPNPTEDPR